MNKKDTFNTGYDTGYSIAQSNILLELDSDNFTQENLDNFISECVSTESDSYRQYSPFEFFAHDINQCYNSDSLWDAYDNGVYKGIEKRVKEFKKDNKKGFKKEVVD